MKKDLLPAKNARENFSVGKKYGKYFSGREKNFRIFF